MSTFWVSEAEAREMVAAGQLRELYAALRRARRNRGDVWGGGSSVPGELDRAARDASERAAWALYYRATRPGEPTPAGSEPTPGPEASALVAIDAVQAQRRENRDATGRIMNQALGHGGTTATFLGVKAFWHPELPEVTSAPLPRTTAQLRSRMAEHCLRMAELEARHEARPIYEAFAGEPARAADRFCAALVDAAPGPRGFGFLHWTFWSAAVGAVVRPLLSDAVTAATIDAAPGPSAPASFWQPALFVTAWLPFRVRAARLASRRPARHFGLSLVDLSQIHGDAIRPALVTLRAQIEPFGLEAALLAAGLGMYAVTQRTKEMRRLDALVERDKARLTRAFELSALLLLLFLLPALVHAAPARPVRHRPACEEVKPGVWARATKHGWSTTPCETEITFRETSRVHVLTVHKATPTACEVWLPVGYLNADKLLSERLEFAEQRCIDSMHAAAEQGGVR